jgi:hypothetical protein
MKRHARKLAALLVFLPIAVSAQVLCALGSGASSYKSADDQRPSPDAMELATKVNEAVKTICQSNCPYVALFRNPTAANAMLVADGSKAKLVYAPQFLTSAYDALGDGAVLAIVAHELGHALDDTLGAAWIKQGWTPEVRADSWAGCALARMNLDPSGEKAFLTTLAKYPSPAHPAWSARLPALRDGYLQCGGNASKFDAAR